MRTKDGAVTKYVYGLGLIGEESGGEFRTYHFDSRGSTVAVTGGMGDVTNTFAYDAYGRLTEKVGMDDILFCYNGKYGVITEPSGLVYMRARYYSPELRRFINADVVAGEISNAITLNRYAYANGNPISNVDPLGLTAERGNENSSAMSLEELRYLLSLLGFDTAQLLGDIEDINFIDVSTTVMINDDTRAALYSALKDVIKTSSRPKGVGARAWQRTVKEANKQLDDILGPTSKLAKGLKSLPYITLGVDVLWGAFENYQNGADSQEILTDAIVDAGVGAGGAFLSTIVSGAVSGFLAGSVAPGVGNLIGAGVGLLVNVLYYGATELIEINGKSLVEWAEEGVGWVVDKVGEGVDWLADTVEDGINWLGDTISGWFD